MKESKLSKVKIDYEKTPKIKKEKENKMKKVEEVKQEKTIKVKTLIIAISVVMLAIVSFIGGIITSNMYNTKITEDAKALSEVMLKKEAK